MKRTRIVSIETKNMSQTFDSGSSLLFKDISFKIPIGKTMVIEGAPGTGKSILLRILAGLLEPTDGDVYYNNMCLREMNFEEFVPIRMSTAVCFENGGLLMNRTLLENLQLGLFYHDQWRAERSQQLLDDLTHHFEITKFLHLRPASVSSGIRKITGIVKTFLSNAQVMFLDEPSLGVGEGGLECLKYWLEKREKVRKPDETLVMACSDEDFIQNFDCKRFQLHHGRLQLTGDSKKVAA